MIKAMFFDLDGTLLDSEKRVPESAVSALRKCKDKGIKLFIATSRTVKAVRILEDSDNWIPLFDGGIFCNGAMNIIDGENSFCYVDNLVSSEIVSVMKNFPHINLALQKQNDVHFFNNKLPECEILCWGLEDDKTFSTENCSCEEILKILIFDGTFTNGMEKLPDQLINKISKICGKRAKFYLTDGSKVIQVCGSSVSKFEGVEYVRKKLRIDKDEVFVFGDDLNDMEMISGFSNSVAMGNSADEIKQVALFVTKSNDEDGIAFAVDKIINNAITIPQSGII